MSNAPLDTSANPSPSAPPGSSPETRAQAMNACLARNWGAVALRGVVAIMFGILTLILPGATLVTIVILFAAYMIVDGVFAIVAAVRAAQKHERWGLLVLEGVANILAGVVAIIWPAITLLVFVYLIAIWSIVSGVLMAIAGFKLNLDHGRWWLVVAGAFSVIFGILLAFAPITGAYVLMLWLGAYAVVFGAMLVGVAFKLRAQRQPGPGSAPPPAGADAAVGRV